MNQKLRLPIDAAVVQAGYKDPQYRAAWGWAHYGADLTSDKKVRELYGLGNGRVIASGLDGTAGDSSGCGYVLVVRYDACENWQSGKTADLICTYMHMAAQPRVKAGDAVTTGTLLGQYGNTGKNTSGPHLHIQFDTDTANPLRCSGLASAGHAILRAGPIDSTVNPLYVLFRADGQSIIGQSAGWWDAADIAGVPKMPEADNEIAILQKEVDTLAAEKRQLADEIGRLTDIINRIADIAKGTA